MPPNNHIACVYSSVIIFAHYNKYWRHIERLGEYLCQVQYYLIDIFANLNKVCLKSERYVQTFKSQDSAHIRLWKHNDVDIEEGQEDAEEDRN